ncbi:MAG: shikimate dehydrogenase [Dissulfuribacterales bacterium]
MAFIQGHSPLNIDAHTMLFGIFGHPVGHSLSPSMHNAAFRHLNINAVYLAFDVMNLHEAITGVRALNIQGLSITIPYKEAVMPFLDEIDSDARAIGAVNTVVNRDGRLLGFNTDCIGARRALNEALRPEKKDFMVMHGQSIQTMQVGMNHATPLLSGKSAVVLGAGGSARAVAFGLKSAGMSVHIANRTVEKAKKLSDVVGGTFSNLHDVCNITADVLVNTTSVGMAPNADEMPIAADCLGNFAVVMDIVYSPLETALLREARRVGCLTVNGLRMLLHQAVCQFELWTGLAAPEDVMEQVLNAMVNG